MVMERFSGLARKVLYFKFQLIFVKAAPRKILCLNINKLDSHTGNMTHAFCESCENVDSRVIICSSTQKHPWYHA